MISTGMRFEDVELEGVRVVRLATQRDARGSFSRTWCRQTFEEERIPFDLVQGNSSMTVSCGSLRGMHLQRQPYAEAKLIRVTRGRIKDVVVDLREESTTRGCTHAMELGEGDDTMLYVPPGLAHGFQTLTDNVIVEYFHGEQPFIAEYQDGFRYDDPATAIDWPLPVTVISERDLSWSPLAERFPWLSRATQRAG